MRWKLHSFCALPLLHLWLFYLHNNPFLKRFPQATLELDWLSQKIHKSKNSIYTKSIPTALQRYSKATYFQKELLIHFKRRNQLLIPRQGKYTFASQTKAKDQDIESTMPQLTLLRATQHFPICPQEHLLSFSLHHCSLTAWHEERGMNCTLAKTPLLHAKQMADKRFMLKTPTEMPYP